MFDQATPILELFTGANERRVEPRLPSDVEICDAITMEARRRDEELVAVSFDAGFLPPRPGSAMPRMLPGRVGVQVHALRILSGRRRGGPVEYELGTAQRNVVLREVDAHWEVTFVQDVAYEDHAQVTRESSDARTRFDDATLGSHVPQIGTPCDARWL